MKKYIKKHWFILTLILISLIRFIYTLNLPNFYLSNLTYDDALVVKLLKFLKANKYLGPYSKLTLIKGPFFVFVSFIINLYKVNYCNVFTILYILVSLYVVVSLKEIIKNKKFLVIIYLVLLFNPATYSQDLFQRLHRNSILIIEFMFFFGSVIRVLFSKNTRINNYLLLGLSLSIMFLTREDNLWTYPVIIFIIIYKYLKDKKIKTLLLNLIPVFILIFSLNLISVINYNVYGIYTYNEIQKSEFHNTYKKILQIKDEEKIDKVSIPKSTLYMLADKTKSFKLTRDNIDYYYSLFAKEGEIYNGNIIWYIRDMVTMYNRFNSVKESEKYYKELGKEIDKLFKEGTLKKEVIMPSIFMAIPTYKELKELPGNILYAVMYTTTYKDIKTLTNISDYKYDNHIHAYKIKYLDYHHTVDITKKNSLRFEIVRIIYKYLSIIFSILALIIYIKNIKKFDRKSIISHILLVCYLLIIGGITYTHTTSFHSIRPIYLGNIYVIQNIFILINISRIKISNIKKAITR